MKAEEAGRQKMPNIGQWRFYRNRTELFRLETHESSIFTYLEICMRKKSSCSPLKEGPYHAFQLYVSAVNKNFSLAFLNDQGTSFQIFLVNSQSLFYPKISCCDISLSIRQISHKSLETIASSDNTVASPTVQQGREGPEPFFPT